MSMLDFQQAKIGSLIKIRFQNTKGSVCLFASKENPMNALVDCLYTKWGGLPFLSHFAKH